MPRDITAARNRTWLSLGFHSGAGPWAWLLPVEAGEAIHRPLTTAVALPSRFSRERGIRPSPQELGAVWPWKPPARAGAPANIPVQPLINGRPMGRPGGCRGSSALSLNGTPWRVSAISLRSPRDICTIWLCRPMVMSGPGAKMSSGNWGLVIRRETSWAAGSVNRGCATHAIR